MSNNILWKSFNLCFSKLKCFPTITAPPPIATATDDQYQDLKSSTTTTNNPSILKNFNSLYDANNYYSSSDNISSSTTTAAAAEDLFSGDSDGESVPDFTSAFASRRFFFSSPGSSNSIFAPAPAAPPPEEDSVEVVSGGVAVQTYSPDPYADFRESMVEMIRARGVIDVKDDWEFLNELLLCYLTLNPKHTHKFIVGAFADVIVSLVLPPAETADDCRKTHVMRQCATS